MSDERNWNPDPYSVSGQPSRQPGQPTENPSGGTGDHAPETQNQETGSGSGMAPRYAHYQMHQQAVCASQTVPRKKESVGKKFAITVSLALVFGLVAGTVFQCVNLVSQKYFKTGTQEKQVNTAELTTATTPAATVSSGTGTSSSGAGSVAEVASAAMPTVVAITSVSVQEIPNFFSLYGFNYGTQAYSSESSGSGIIVGENDDELLIATNNHVVSGATTLSVCFIGNDTSGNSGGDTSGDTSGTENTSSSSDSSGDINVEDAVNAKIKGTDTTNDLAVVAVQKSDIPSDTLSRIKIAQIGNSDSLQVGEQVVAIGNALGYGQSVTSGWVSALNRSISTDDGTSSGLIQTDAAINPGNSGGALLNMNGEVIGINSAKYADSAVEGMGYAIPISKAKPILEELMNRQTRDKVDASQAGYLGIEMANISSKTLEMYGMPSGAFVSRVLEGGGAALAGMQKGDIIVKFDGQSITDVSDLNNVMAYYAAGETVNVVVSRASDGVYEEQTLSVTLGSSTGYGE